MSQFNMNFGSGFDGGFNGGFGFQNPQNRVDQRIANRQNNQQVNQAGQNSNLFNNTPNQQVSNQRLGDAINNVDLSSIIQQQLGRTDQINNQSDADRALAIGGVQGQQQQIQDLINQMSGQQGPSEFEQFLQQAIQGQINNPFQLDTAAASAGFRSTSARGLQDLLGEQGRQFASRGLGQSGISQGQDAFARENALNSIIGNDRDLALQSAQGREASLQNSFGAGNNLAGIQGSRLSSLAGTQAGLAGTSAGLQGLLSQLQAPNRQLPDFSGFAGLALDQKNSQQGAEQQRASLEILARQLGLGASNFDKFGHTNNPFGGSLSQLQQEKTIDQQGFLQQLLQGVS